jgi:hypothetical protein
MPDFQKLEKTEDSWHYYLARFTCHTIASTEFNNSLLPWIIVAAGRSAGQARAGSVLGLSPRRGTNLMQPNRFEQWPWHQSNRIIEIWIRNRTWDMSEKDGLTCNVSSLSLKLLWSVCCNLWNLSSSSSSCVYVWSIWTSILCGQLIVVHLKEFIWIIVFWRHNNFYMGRENRCENLSIL